MRSALSAWLAVATLGLAPVAATGTGQKDAGAASTEPKAAITSPHAERKGTNGSLLFSRRIQDLIEAARREAAAITAAAPAEVRPPSSEPDAVHLSAILYGGPGDWQIWLNGRSFAESGIAGAFEVLRVQRDSVRLKWRSAGARQSTEITLRPNQTYIVATGEIVEGPPGRAWRASARPEADSRSQDGHEEP